MRKFENNNDIKKFLGISEESEASRTKVTPKMAKYLLNHCNKTNRRINRSHVETLKRDMESGRWFNDVDYIGFNNGVLINGQHRLKALSLANVDNIELKFDFNVEQHISMDTGRNRTYASQVTISRKHGIDIMPSHFKTIIQAGLKLNDPKIQLSNSEICEIWDARKEDLIKCEEAGLFDLGSKAGSVVRSSFFWAYISGVDINKLSHIAKVLKTGIIKSDYDIPIIRLRDELFDLRGSGKAIDAKRAAYTQQMIYNVVVVKSTSNRLPSNPIMHYQETKLV